MRSDVFGSKHGKVVNIHVEKLPEGVYLAPSDDIPGLVTQGMTVSETLEIARDVAKKLMASQEENVAMGRAGRTVIELLNSAPPLDSEKRFVQAT